MREVIVVGAGLAGSEAAYQLANLGIKVKLYEQKPIKRHDAFKTDLYSELICSNSLRSDDLNNAVGLLKEEMRILDSLIMEAAEKNKVEAGKSLAVDRIGFSKYITDKINNHPNIEVIHEEYTIINEDIPTIIASGPLCEGELSSQIQKLAGKNYLYFYDAVSPIVEKDSIDFNYAYYKSRYDEDGEGDYINCPLNQEEFFTFYNEVINAKKIEVHDIDSEIYFEGCMPFEEMARRGKQTLLFGPMKPVGLEHDGLRPYAVVQLRKDNAIDTLYNIVGFQTHLTWPEQRRVFSLIPGLENLKITRYGVMHRNSYLSSPVLLKETYQSKDREDLFFAGQLTGVEGYVESCASGCIAGINMALYMQGKDCIEFGNTCVMGSQAYYITHCDSKHFQPMNANFGIMHLNEKCKKFERKEKMAKQAIARIDEIVEALNG